MAEAGGSRSRSRRNTRTQRRGTAGAAASGRETPDADAAGSSSATPDKPSDKAEAATSAQPGDQDAVVPGNERAVPASSEYDVPVTVLSCLNHSSCADASACSGAASSPVTRPRSGSASSHGSNRSGQRRRRSSSERRRATKAAALGREQGARLLEMIREDPKEDTRIKYQIAELYAMRFSSQVRSSPPENVPSVILRAVSLADVPRSLSKPVFERDVVKASTAAARRAAVDLARGPDAKRTAKQMLRDKERRDRKQATEQQRDRGADGKRRPVGAGGSAATGGKASGPAEATGDPTRDAKPSAQQERRRRGNDPEWMTEDATPVSMEAFMPRDEKRAELFERQLRESRRAAGGAVSDDDGDDADAGGDTKTAPSQQPGTTSGEPAARVHALSSLKQTSIESANDLLRAIQQQPQHDEGSGADVVDLVDVVDVPDSLDDDAVAGNGVGGEGAGRRGGRFSRWFKGSDDAEEAAATKPAAPPQPKELMELLQQQQHQDTSGGKDMSGDDVLDPAAHVLDLLHESAPPSPTSQPMASPLPAHGSMASPLPPPGKAYGAAGGAPRRAQSPLPPPQSVPSQTASVVGVKMDANQLFSMVQHSEQALPSIHDLPRNAIPQQQHQANVIQQQQQQQQQQHQLRQHQQQHHAHHHHHHHQQQPAHRHAPPHPPAQMMQHGHQPQPPHMMQPGGRMGGPQPPFPAPGVVPMHVPQPQQQRQPLLAQPLPGYPQPMHGNAPALMPTPHAYPQAGHPQAPPMQQQQQQPVQPQSAPANPGAALMAMLGVAPSSSKQQVQHPRTQHVHPHQQAGASILPGTAGMSLLPPMQRPQHQPQQHQPQRGAGGDAGGLGRFFDQSTLASAARHAPPPPPAGAAPLRKMTSVEDLEKAMMRDL